MTKLQRYCRMADGFFLFLKRQQTTCYLLFLITSVSCPQQPCFALPRLHRFGFQCATVKKMACES